MASTWPGASYAGPWNDDDTAVLCDGLESDLGGLPTLDGERPDRGGRRRRRPLRDEEFEVLGITTGYK